MKMMIGALLLLIAAPLYGQSVTGYVLDDNNNPLENVIIFNTNSEKHSHTNATGFFSINNTNAGDSLYFSNLGYETHIYVLTNRDEEKTFTIVLEPKSFSLDQIVLVSEVNQLSKIVDIDVQNNPVKSSQEILRKVPGLIIGQHAGGGKAEQIFLRGFDIDHGTDLALSVDGLPVNMVSHAHGQGYSDLHFVIPETIQNIEFGKGPFYAEHGNFTTAGYIDLKLKDVVEENLITLEVGQFNSKRLAGLFPVLNKTNSSLYLASEITLTDGPFESPQNFNRLNLLSKYVYSIPGEQELDVTLSHFQSKWDASGQIPERAVASGLISRFGAIDDTEGGFTSRSNLSIDYSKNINDHNSFKTAAFLSKYDFELYSNFTFFLEDPINGDQIRQKEDRVLMGVSSVFERKNLTLGNFDVDYNTGVGLRYDDVNDVELSRTKNRKETLEYLSLGDVDELNGFGFFNIDFNMGDWKFNPSLRVDYFKFDYINALSTLYDHRSESKVAASPKFNIIYSPSSKVQYFVKSGIGFHSNDTRVVVANEGEDILPAAYGLDIGTILKPVDRLVLNAAVWNLHLDQEFVYVGDAGIVEPSGKSRRLGVEFGARYQFNDWLYAYSDINYTHARSVDEPDGEDFIPLAPDFTAVGGINIENLGAFSGSLAYRYIDDRPANEDNSIVAEGYFIIDMNVNYRRGNWTYGIVIENLFDTEWNETQFATESRLASEAQSVEEIHFTPGVPFFLRGKISVSF
ncbi:TonB-dependent receptor [Dokdonia sp. Hel_I_53]|uniref:TonB-dependent receptor n=1 Tax=Dokdonia sp. Hel_I_53 TaxID=1566287 RepID=UPI0011A46E0C|nr:carboxypeptidase-like regulatory domain-containing protein [Dokdonia sp. Hel_I_53]